MTEADYLRRELLEAKTLLARCQGIMEANAIAFPETMPDGGVSERTIGDIRGCLSRGIYVMPEGVDHA